MKMRGRAIVGLALASVAWWGAAEAQAPLTADRAVQLALEHNSQVVGANAGVLQAKGSLYGAYAGLLPHVSAGFSRQGSRTDQSSGTQLFGSIVTPSVTTDNTSYTNTPGLSGSWSILNLSSFAGLSSARAGMKASQEQRRAIRNEVALSARRQFYEVVKSVHLAQVAANALALAHDNERRVRALFEVGSVSRSDLLKAQVATAQSQLDSIYARQAVVVQRVTLAGLIGLEESAMGDVDTVLAVTPRVYDEAGLLAEAERNRPDLQAAWSDLRSARAAVTSARFARLPYIALTGSASFDPTRSFRQKSYGTSPIYGPSYVPSGDSLVVRDIIGYTTDPVTSGRNRADRSYAGAIAINWDFFDGLETDARIATARARLLQAQNSYEVLKRNLAGEVHQYVLGYQQSLAQDEVARSALASATENLKLTQQKYNVGSATILELIDAQVQLERAESDQVSARAGIRVAEATLERVRGRGGE
jgi:outer membrane protein TolC